MVVVVAVVVVAVIVLIDYYLSLYQVVRWLVEQKHVGALVGEEGVVERMGNSALLESKSCTLIFMLGRFFLFSFPSIGVVIFLVFLYLQGQHGKYDARLDAIREFAWGMCVWEGG